MCGKTRCAAKSQMLPTPLCWVPYIHNWRKCQISEVCEHEDGFMYSLNSIHRCPKLRTFSGRLSVLHFHLLQMLFCAAFCLSVPPPFLLCVSQVPGHYVNPHILASPCARLCYLTTVAHQKCQEAHGTACQDLCSIPSKT